MDCPKAKESVKSKSNDALRKTSTKSKPTKRMPRKDPNAPKRAMTTYLLFANDKRAEIRAANPDWKMTDVTKELGRLWQEAGRDVKDKYQKIADEDKQRYEKEIKEFNKKM